MIHEWITIYQGLSRFYYVNVMISQGHSIPENVTFGICAMRLLSIAALANNVLYSINFCAAVRRVDYYVLLILWRTHIRSAGHHCR